MKEINWERIELDYRAGVKTLREIADEHGITHGAINKRARRDGWVRDLSAKVKAQADYLVSKNEVSKEVSKEARILESEIIAANATKSAEIQVRERSDVTKVGATVMALWDELGSQTAHEELYKNLGELLQSQDEKKLSDMYQKVISFPGRVDCTKKLIDSLKTLIDLERKVYKIDDVGSEDSFEDWLKKARNA